MFDWLARKAKLFSIRKALKRKTPDQFHFSSEADYFATILRKRDTGEEVLVQSFSDSTISGLAWTGERFEDSVEVPLSEIDDWSVRFRRYYGFMTINYENLRDFFYAECTLYPQRQHVRGWLSQTTYNYRTRFRHDRIEVLRKLVDLHLTEAEKNTGLLFTGSKKDIVELLSSFYGNRIYGHPNHEAESARFRLILESLAETGEVKKHNMHEFELNAGAVATISNYELEERRHKDSVRQNRLLLVVTIVMAVAAIVQAASVVL
ncbi:MAG: hypothetical protein IH625_09625 [Rhodobacteraceae bacterium]|nr:hypothetical protein [Paracoccaceae bacterium]